MNRFVCIHGHFYQPPRDDPRTGEIPEQPSAAPFHDWNQRITEECYRPNGASRVLVGGRLVRTVNNYERVSHNFGPTLAAWLAAEAPDVYALVRDADDAGRVRFGGHGPALAQVHDHPILPLCDDRDRRTQVRWGVRDFVYRYGRDPEGMWLPETAVNTASLEELAAAGIRYTVLAPHQAEWVCPPDGKRTGVTRDTLDPRRPYRVDLPSGRSIAVFLYDGDLALSVAFETLLENGDRFARRMLACFDDRDEPQLVHFATDGETYGHHQRFGEMGLTRALDVIDAEAGVELTTYGEFLERFPPAWTAGIREDTSWSCAHGVERWRSDCGCQTGGEEGWSQAWRAPLREAIDGLRDDLAASYEASAAPLLRDPWAARDEAVDLLLEPHRADAFLDRHVASGVDADGRAAALSLLDMQRNALRMQTSCGWFFHDLAGIETGQILVYAARALELEEEATGRSSRPAFLERLARAHSNQPGMGTGRDLFERLLVRWNPDFTEDA